jgi:hypothetical protein
MHEIEFVHVDTLRPNPRNAHTHSKKQTHQIADSIVACGFATPVLIDENSMLTVAEVGPQMGYFPRRGCFSSDSYPVCRAPRDSDPEEFGSLIRHPRP